MGCSPLGARYSTTNSPQILQANLLQSKPISPPVCRSCQEPAPAQVFHGITASFGSHYTCFGGGSSRVCRCFSASPWISTGYRVTGASPCSITQAAGRSLLQTWSSCPFLTPDLGGCILTPAFWVHIVKKLFPLLKHIFLRGATITCDELVLGQHESVL